jgi:Carboxypeptidase regulatory-like domain
VTVDGAPAFGAQVVAVAASGAVAASALTSPNGQYAVEQLAPGSYTLYVEPLDGPASSVPGGCTRFGNLSGAGIYSNATLTTNFPTRFENEIAVAAGQVTTVNFALPSGAPPVNPVEIGPAVVNGGSISASVATSPLGVMAGGDQWLAVAGPNVDQVPIDGIDLGPGIAVDPTSRRMLSSTCNGDPFPFLVFRIEVAPGTVPGGRSIIFTVDGQPVAMTGAVRIAAESAPCVGDCTGDSTVTIDDLASGVGITLGALPLAECSAFDFNHDMQVTVDELSLGVRSAIDGCK